MTIDDIDWKLIGFLQENARLRFSELAPRVHLSPPAVAERIRRLEEAGIISGYHASIDPAKLGFPITAIIRMSVRSGERCREMLVSLQDIPEVIDAFRVTGTDSAVVTAYASSTDHLEDLIDRIGLFGKPTTSIVTSRFRRIPAFSKLRGPEK